MAASENDRSVSNHAMPPQALELVAARFRAMGEPIRLRILQALQAGELSVTALTKEVGSTQPNVSKHLRVLQEVALVGRRPVGNTAYYFIAEPMIFDLCQMVCSAMRDLLETQVGILRSVTGRFPRP